jgi:hypothetical protein
LTTAVVLALTTAVVSDEAGTAVVLLRAAVFFRALVCAGAAVPDGAAVLDGADVFGVAAVFVARRFCRCGVLADRRAGGIGFAFADEFDERGGARQLFEPVGDAGL